MCQQRKFEQKGRFQAKSYREEIFDRDAVTEQLKSDSSILYFYLKNNPDRRPEEEFWRCVSSEQILSPHCNPMSQQGVKFLLLWWHLFLNQVMHCSFTLVLWSQSLWARSHPHSSALLQEPVGDVRKKTGSKTISWMSTFQCLMRKWLVCLIMSDQTHTHTHTRVRLTKWCTLRARPEQCILLFSAKLNTIHFNKTCDDQSV